MWNPLHPPGHQPGTHVPGTTVPIPHAMGLAPQSPAGIIRIDTSLSAENEALLAEVKAIGDPIERLFRAVMILGTDGPHSEPSINRMVTDATGLKHSNDVLFWGEDTRRRITDPDIAAWFAARARLDGLAPDFDMRWPVLSVSHRGKPRGHPPWFAVRYGSPVGVWRIPNEAIKWAVSPRAEIDGRPGGAFVSANGELFIEWRQLHSKGKPIGLESGGHFTLDTLMYLGRKIWPTR